MGEIIIKSKTEKKIKSYRTHLTKYNRLSYLAKILRVDSAVSFPTLQLQ